MNNTLESKTTLTTDEIHALGHPVVEHGGVKIFLVDTEELMRTAFNTFGWSSLHANAPESERARFFDHYNGSGNIYVVLDGDEPVYYPYYQYSSRFNGRNRVSYELEMITNTKNECFILDEIPASDSVIDAILKLNHLLIIN